MVHAVGSGRTLVKLRAVAVASLLAALQQGCHTMQFEVANQESVEVVHHRKSFWFWGLTQVEVDVSDYCPAGVAAVREETRFVDGLFDFLTLGIWTPRSSWYYCLPEPGEEEAA